MGKSVSAKIAAELLKLWSKYTAEGRRQSFQDILEEGEKRSSAPILLRARQEDNEYGRIVYVHEDPTSRYVVFYLHGGAYLQDIILPHWQFIDRLAKKTEAEVIVPLYRLVPFATYQEAFDLIVPLYKHISETYPDKKIILMGDSAGGGLSLALAEFFKAENIRMPDELVLLSPWVDAVMENEELAEYEKKDPFLDIASLKPPAERWAGDLEVRDPKISPIFGDLKEIRNVTAFVGTSELFYPDVVRFYQMLDPDPANELVIGEEMNHVYPLFPIPEAKSALNKIFEVVMR